MGASSWPWVLVKNSQVWYRKHKQQNKKVDETSSKSKAFVVQRTPLRKWKTTHKRENIFANHVSD